MAVDQTGRVVVVSFIKRNTNTRAENTFTPLNETTLIFSPSIHPSMPEMKSNFAVTCNLLSQYIKDRGGAIADLGALGIAAAAPPPTAGRPGTMSYSPGAAGEEKDARSMDLFPQRAGFGPTPDVSNNAAPPLPEKAQLTIFYGGKVMVFDNFPAEKAKDLMSMASKSGGATPAAAPNRPNCPSTVAPVSANPPAAVQQQGSADKPPQPNVSNLPLARSKSLHRFLEKRKDRIQAKAPYQSSESKAPAVKKEQEESPSWLGLGPQMSKPGLNSESTR